MKYRITASRFDIPEHVIKTFEADPNNDDLRAKLKFAEYKGNQNYIWDTLSLIRVDQEEKTTLLNSRIPQ